MTHLQCFAIIPAADNTLHHAVLLQTSSKNVMTKQRTTAATKTVQRTVIKYGRLQIQLEIRGSLVPQRCITLSNLTYICTECFDTKFSHFICSHYGLLGITDHASPLKRQKVKRELSCSVAD